MRFCHGVICSMADHENDVLTEYPVREIEVRYGVDEEGGGVVIHVRMDGETPERILDVVMKILEKINGKDKGGSHGPGYC